MNKLPKFFWEVAWGDEINHRHIKNFYSRDEASEFANRLYLKHGNPLRGVPVRGIFAIPQHLVSTMIFEDGFLIEVCIQEIK